MILPVNSYEASFPFEKKPKIYGRDVENVQFVQEYEILLEKKI